MGSIPPERARQILPLNFTPEQHARYEVLSNRAQSGTLTPAEAAELDEFLRTDSMLATLRVRAMRSLDEGA